MFDYVGFLVSWLTLFAIYGILAMCLNMEVGNTGMANFGLVAFVGIGGFVTGYTAITVFLRYFGYNFPIYSLDAIITLGKISKENPALSLGVFALCLVLSFVVAGFFGYLISYPTLRVGPSFLGITILSFGEMMRVFMKHFEPTGATYGLLGIPGPFTWVADPKQKSILFLMLTLTILVLVYVYFNRITNSPFGRLIRSIREDEVASLCMGKPVPQIKAKLLFVASGISGIAGSLLVFYYGSVSPDLFVTAVTFEIWSMVILGGRGNNLGALIGAGVLTLFGRATSLFNFMFPDFVIDHNYLRWMLLGLTIVVVLLFKPEGLISEKVLKTDSWNVYGGYPKSRVSNLPSRIREGLSKVLKRGS